MIPGSALTAATNLRGAKELRNDGKQPPEQIHLALAGNKDGISDGMAVSWSTPNATKTSIVKYGTKSGHYDHEASGSQTTYNKDWYYHHHAVMADLEPNTKYYYIVGDEDAGFSKEFNFVTAPENDMDLPLKLMVYGA